MRGRYRFRQVARAVALGLDFPNDFGFGKRKPAVQMHKNTAHTHRVPRTAARRSRSAAAATGTAPRPPVPERERTAGRSTPMQHPLPAVMAGVDTKIRCVHVHVFTVCIPDRSVPYGQR
jgi:hypothetical protein